MTGTVRNNAEQSRYELEVDGFTAFVSYHRENEAVSLDHTIVPKELGGRGVGSTLAKGTLDLVRGGGLKIIPRCSFIAGYIDKHPEYRDLVVS